MNRSDEFWELAIAVNAAVKGLLGSLGESGHICARVEAPEQWLRLDDGWPATRSAVVDGVADHLQDGDVVVVADKILAVSLGRLTDRSVLLTPDPKTIPVQERRELAAALEQRLGMPVSDLHLLIADEHADDQASLGTDEPNARAAELAAAVRERTGFAVDVVISDTDTGLDVRWPLIGTLTIGATPIGATAGLNLYEAMRCAVAAEFARGHRRGIPAVVCKPADRRRRRDLTGLARDYPGFLHIDREGGLTHA